MNLKSEIQSLGTSDIYDVAKDLSDVLMGEHLGAGSSRQVFEFHNRGTGAVIKLAKDVAFQSNVIEYSIWQDFCETDEGKRWLAKVDHISDSGRILVQERLSIIKRVGDPRLPKKIPSFMTDTKIENWGVDKQNRVKCCDYGNSLLMQGDPWKLKKAEWWSAKDLD